MARLTYEKVKPYSSLQELIEAMPQNGNLIERAIICWSKINSPSYKDDEIMLSISGGWDSTCMLDLVARCNKSNKRIRCVWFDTGLAYKEEKAFLDLLEERYGYEIEKFRAKKPIPTVCKEYGAPFLSKEVSEYIYRLQKHNYDFSDTLPFEKQLEKYCTKAPEEEVPLLDAKRLAGESIPYSYINENYYKGCVSALMWICNAKGSSPDEASRFNIDKHRGLREFLRQNPPPRISGKCCDYSKKKPAHSFIKENGIKLSLTAVRKAEGGARATGYTNCFTADVNGVDYYRPLFFWSDNDKMEYTMHFDVPRHKLYELGCMRTGCCGCPFGLNYKSELSLADEIDPNLAKAARVIFSSSYDYQQQYYEFRANLKNGIENASDKSKIGYQYNIFDYIEKKVV